MIVDIILERLALEDVSGRTSLGVEKEGKVDEIETTSLSVKNQTN